MKKAVSLLLALTMALSLTACGGSKDASKDTQSGTKAASGESQAAGGDAETIKIGLCQPFTGSVAVAGEYSRRGVYLAV